MSWQGQSLCVAAIGVAACLQLLAPAALAHQTQEVGPFRVLIGWGEEPVFSGVKNIVEVAVSAARGAPVVDRGAQLAVEVSFGDERMVLPLVPDGKRPGRFQASLVPTRPGTYTFRVTGKLKGQALDTQSTCSDKTYDCAVDISEIQFPAKDPSSGQLAQSVSRALLRAERAEEKAARAEAIAIAAGVVALAALASAIYVGFLKGRKGD